MVACSVCGEENPERARFCLNCGTPIATAAGGREARKVVTVVFSDLAGSTSLGERLDPESLGRVMARWFEAMRAVLEHHGGTVQKFIGDAVMAVFGIPALHEDDAVRAVRAAPSCCGSRHRAARRCGPSRRRRWRGPTDRLGAEIGEAELQQASAVLDRVLQALRKPAFSPDSG